MTLIGIGLSNYKIVIAEMDKQSNKKISKDKNTFITNVNFNNNRNGITLL